MQEIQQDRKKMKLNLEVTVYTREDKKNHQRNNLKKKNVPTENNTQFRLGTEQTETAKLHSQ